MSMTKKNYEGLEYSVQEYHSTSGRNSTVDSRLVLFHLAASVRAQRQGLLQLAEGWWPTFSRSISALTIAVHGHVHHAVRRAARSIGTSSFDESTSFYHG